MNYFESEAATRHLVQLEALLLTGTRPQLMSFFHDLDVDRYHDILVNVSVDTVLQLVEKIRVSSTTNTDLPMLFFEISALGFLPLHPRCVIEPDEPKRRSWVYAADPKLYETLLSLYQNYDLVRDRLVTVQDLPKLATESSRSTRI